MLFVFSVWPYSKLSILIDGIMSEALTLFRGVPQASILGFLCVSKYISDFHQFASKCHIFYFAGLSNVRKVSKTPKKFLHRIVLFFTE